jgi:uncharacterized protein
MNEAHIATIAEELHLQQEKVRSTARLLAEGGTVPFIARYRKEQTGGLDEVQIIAVRDRVEQLAELDKRRESILKSLHDQGKLTDELKTQVLAAETLAALEDIYLPYRPKRRTRGMVAKERGLEPLARRIFAQKGIDPVAEAVAFVTPDKGVGSVQEALAGARDIIAEWINENAEARARLRKLFAEKAVMRTRVIPGREQEGAKFRDYFDWEEPMARAPSHRILAVRRGAAEGYLALRILPDEEEAVGLLAKRFIVSEGPASEQMGLAIRDSYKRLLSLSLETEMRTEAKKRADEEAIRVFAENLRHLLLAPPLGQKAVLAVDPGYRTGCKVVCLDRQGKLLGHETLYPLEPHHREAEAARTLRDLVERFAVEAIAVGNGTGGREALAFCKGIDFGRPVSLVLVNESGASVYSASKIAREEFPDHEVTVRGAVSIGRRLMDPLAELVKIEPKSIGVGQYQHDVDQKALQRALDDVVVSCVNAVGVEVNTASKMLLRYVSGLSERLAGNLIDFRDEHGAFRSRGRLTSVAGMGPKTFEQAAGFLRIRDAENPLDASAVHPESYPVVERMAADLSCSVAELMRDPELREKVKLENYVGGRVGMPTLIDILAELAKPGRDPREPFEAFDFKEGVHAITDLEVGMQLPGVVTNVTAFGAFVDIGVHQDGLVHISEISEKYVRNPHDLVKVQQKVTVTVIGVDQARGRISLSMRKAPLQTGKRRPLRPESAGTPSGPGARSRQRDPKKPANPFAKALKDWKPGGS